MVCEVFLYFLFFVAAKSFLYDGAYEYLVSNYQIATVFMKSHDMILSTT